MLKIHNFPQKKKAADQKTYGSPLATKNRAQDKDRSDDTERDVKVDNVAHVEPKCAQHAEDYEILCKRLHLESPWS